ncbi:HAD family hydrolase [Alkaliphilus oremlandii]|uniref:HAD-superfamily hydrolase, subfamily IA, variant 1 n=1 Tax=Alkaliphilus oremlandii (strain OhILAs) TaxID=350688 RepID=A8MJI2_ALKOO|nr:HAD family hydrolase [Alkaliphilus oremlandii]ABW19964.1 HAD-superfamily hydrolase, subfamily IA, variant 1 [Alkaliphilus oremlandii OhILAs]
MNFSNVDGIIFDLDGTLWDSTELVLTAWNSVLRKREDVRAEITLEDLKNVMGLQIKEIGQKFFPYLDESAQGEIMKECCALECEYILKQGGKLFDDLEQVLQELSKKYKLFIVSNCQNGYIEGFFQYHQLGQYFVDYECAEGTGLPKADNISLVIERNNLKNPVYIGDTQGDRNACLTAKVPFIFAHYGYGDVDGYDHKISSLLELTTLFPTV